MKWSMRGKWIGLLIIAALLMTSSSCPRWNQVIGVLVVVHGGGSERSAQGNWDTGVQMFAYDPNHPVYTDFIWNSAMWGFMGFTEMSRKNEGKYGFEYERIGGRDPFNDHTAVQIEEMQTALDDNPYGITFEVDWACWICGEDIENYPYPRFLLNHPEGEGDRLEYCGGDDPDESWEGCDPNRYDVDGPIDRLVDKGVSRIIVIDVTVGAVRFFKTHQAYEMAKRRLDELNAENGTAIPMLWVNDYSSLMDRSYPTSPEGWTSTLGKDVEGFQDSHVLLNGSPNPLAEDPDLAALTVAGIEARMSPPVSAANTGILILNHAVRENGEPYDPKIDDTLIVNRNIESQLLSKYPDMDRDNIVGAYMGVKEVNPDNELLERTREMRGENIGHAYMYETMGELPSGKWGYRYWDALEYLKNRGVQHIVVGFVQIVTHSVLDLVEIPNQIAKEIGHKNWLQWEEGDDSWYPGVGHPFADYWGCWVDTECDGEPCCFEMGGCNDGRPYPPPRQTAMDNDRGDMDPSLAYEVCEYGHLGYDPDVGLPNPDAPVQDQYTGTWAVWDPPSEGEGIGELMAKHVLEAAVNPMVYVTNGEVEGVAAGESVTWQAHVVTGAPNYKYEWSIRAEGATDWTSVGDDSETWTWTPAAGEAGTYEVRCTVTDRMRGTGEVIWKDFEVS